MARHPYRRLRSARFALPEVGISEHGNIRSLHLGSETVQSSMNVDYPAELVLSYSRAMMAWLLFAENVRHITQIGLGGGSFVRWIDAHLSEVAQTAVEINPQVISVARGLFELPFEGEKFEIIEADGAEYIKTLRGGTDVLLVDGFDGVQIIGIFVTNWWSGDKRYPLFLQRLAQVFEQRVLCVPAETHGNVAVLAFQNQAPQPLAALQKKAAKLGEQYGLDFKTMLHQAHVPPGSTWQWLR